MIAIAIAIAIAVMIAVARAIGHAVVAVPALTARAVAMLFDQASGHQAQGHASDQELHWITFARGWLRHD
ncbi:MAG TPA: hypothetical protein VFQ65_04825, partial [Kofleriaceae bacterium]|nr:hypothetical protein [Kofleriaceae bacterium]